MLMDGSFNNIYIEHDYNKRNLLAFELSAINDNEAYYSMPIKIQDVVGERPFDWF